MRSYGVIREPEVTTGLAALRVGRVSGERIGFCGLLTRPSRSSVAVEVDAGVGGETAQESFGVS